VDPGDIDFPPLTTTTAASEPDSTVVPLPSTTAAPPPSGGTVLVGVWSEPNPALETLVGAGVRSLIYPQLFEPAADGTWAYGLVEPGSDSDGPEFRSASFSFRPGAEWSDGTAITVDDLAASADVRFVESVTMNTDGMIEVQFTQPLPNWRRLWSGDAVIRPSSVASSGEFGGPFVVAEMTPGLVTVLRANDSWWGEGPYIDELRFVLVPDQLVQLDLFERGELDVIAPWPATGRLDRLAQLGEGRVATADGDGWWYGLTIDVDQVDRVDAGVLTTAAAVETFVGALLKGEAALVSSLGGGAVTYDERDPGDLSTTIGLSSPNDLPLSGTVKRALLLPIREAGGRVPELREGKSSDAEVWAVSAAASLGLNYDGVGGPCWTCRFSAVDEVAMRLADGGGLAPDQLLADAAAVRPWWRPVLVVAWAPRINGVEANGWAITPAWNADQWWVGDDG